MKKTREILKSAGFKVVRSNAKNYDITLIIKAEGEALSARYKRQIFPFVSRRDPLFRTVPSIDLYAPSYTLYVGARISGEILLEAPGIPVIQEFFYGEKSPPSEIGVVSKDFSYLYDPSSAPFEEVFKNSSFTEKMLNVIDRYKFREYLHKKYGSSRNIVGRLS